MRVCAQLLDPSPAATLLQPRPPRLSRRSSLHLDMALLSLTVHDIPRRPAFIAACAFCSHLGVSFPCAVIPAAVTNVIRVCCAARGRITDATGGSCPTGNLVVNRYLPLKLATVQVIRRSWSLWIFTLTKLRPLRRPPQTFLRK